jgi:FdhD protein
VQPLHTETRAVHAAGFYVPGKGIVIGARGCRPSQCAGQAGGRAGRAGIDAGSGAVVVTSRVSVEMVQKTAIIGSRPSSSPFRRRRRLPSARRDEAGMTLIALVRGDDFEIFTHPDRIQSGAIADVA